MFRKYYRLFSVILCIMMLLSFVTGCARNNNNTHTGGNNSSSTDKEGGGGKSIESGAFAGLKFNPEGMDLNGETIVYAVHGILRSADDPDATPAEKARWARYKKAEDFFNVNIETRTWSHVDNMRETFISEYLSGIKSADIFQTTTGFSTPMMMEMGMVSPVDEYIDFDNSEWNQFKDIRYLDGNRYYLARDVVPTTMMTIYNEELLRSEGIEDIMSIYERGEWTWDKLKDILIKTTRDTTGGGTNDQFGMLTNATIGPLLASNGVLKLMPGNGTLELGLYSDEAMESFDFFWEVSVEQKFTSTVDNDFAEGRVAFAFGYSWHMDWWVNRMGMESVRSAPLPMGPSLDSDVIISENIHVNLLSSISDFTPEEAITVFMYSNYNDPKDPDVYIDERFEYISGYSQYFNTVEEVEFWYDFCSKTPFLLDYAYGIQTVYNMINLDVINRIQGGTPPATVLESVRPMLEQEIKDALEY